MRKQPGNVYPNILFDSIDIFFLLFQNCNTIIGYLCLLFFGFNAHTTNKTIVTTLRMEIKTKYLTNFINFFFNFRKNNEA